MMEVTPTNNQSQINQSHLVLNHGVKNQSLEFIRAVEDIIQI